MHVLFESLLLQIHDKLTHKVLPALEWINSRDYSSGLKTHRVVIAVLNYLNDPIVTGNLKTISKNVRAPFQYIEYRFRQDRETTGSSRCLMPI
jgi:hypothetical protein